MGGLPPIAAEALEALPPQVADRGCLDPEQDDRDLIVAQDILHLADALRHTIQLYRDLALRP